MWERAPETFAQRFVRPAGHVHEVSVRVRQRWRYMRALLWMQVTFASRLVVYVCLAVCLFNPQTYTK